MIKNSIFYSLALILLTFFSFPTSGQVSQMTNTSNTDTTKFATFFIYGTNTIAYDYDIYLNDSMICIIKNKTRYVIKVYKEGTAELSSKAKDDRKIKVTIKFGQEYYLKCTHILSVGGLFGRWQPEINLILSEQGRLEFENLKPKNTLTKRKK